MTERRQDEELQSIKKLFGEKFEKFCRNKFSTILENNGELIRYLLTLFEPTHFLYDDLINQNKLEELVVYIYGIFSQTQVNKKIKQSYTLDSPAELMAKSKYKYTLYECETNEDVKRFRDYYEPREELCTFIDAERISNYHIFFAVSENADLLRRRDFINPKREDDYGVSVISLQFRKGDYNFLSIKNRYNHSVKNPDATFSNNLDNITEGLTESFLSYYGFSFLNQDDLDFDMFHYTQANNGKLYKVNYNINDFFICPNNIFIIDGEPILYDPSRYVMADYFLFDRKLKTVDILVDVEDSFMDYFDSNNITKINVENLPNKQRLINVVTEQGEVKIKIDELNQIIGYENQNITEIGDCFLNMNIVLKEFIAPKLEYIGDEFLFTNQNLTTLDIHNVTQIGNEFMYNNRGLENLDVSSLVKTNYEFLCLNDSLKNIKCNNNTIFGVGSLLYCPDNILDNIHIEQES